MSENIQFFMPIGKIDKVRRTVSGYASTPAIDLDGEVVSIDAIKKALPGYMAWRNIRRMHLNDAVGVAQEANVDKNGLFLTAKIVDDDAWHKCVEGVYKGFSIGGKKLAKTGNTITDIDLVEISIVDRPANPECKFDVHKNATAESSAYLVKMADQKPTQIEKAVRQLAKTAHLLAKGTQRCEEHGTLDCEECLDKRNVSPKERKDLAGKGDANPDGSFPIKTKEDLKNAIDLRGHGDPKRNKKLIVRRARELGATDMLPKQWAKKAAKKEAKAAKKTAESAIDKTVNLNLSSDSNPDALMKSFLSQASSFLTLEPGDDRAVAVEGLDLFGQSIKRDGSTVPRKDGLKKGQKPTVLLEPDLNEKPELGKLIKVGKIMKRMQAAGDLAFAFDRLRSIQRQLIQEGKAEGKDSKDYQLATQIGSAAENLAAVISQKALHEAEEARSLSDVDDRWLFPLLEDQDMNMSARTDTSVDALNLFVRNALQKAAKTDGEKPNPFAERQAKDIKKANKAMKQAKAARNEAIDCVKAAHDTLKKSYLAKGLELAKAGKNPKDDDDMEEMGKALQALSKAAAAIKNSGTFTKAGVGILTKAAGRVGNGGTGPGDLNEFHTYAPGLTNLNQSDLVHAGPGTKERTGEPPILSMTDTIKSLQAGDLLTVREAEAMAKAARAEALAEVYSRMPNGPTFGQRPRLIDTDMFKSANGSQESELWKGVDTNAIGSGNERAHQHAVGTYIGNMIFKGAGKSMMDPTFQGGAGAGRRAS